jgi:hypothetical protein
LGGSNTSNKNSAKGGMQLNLKKVELKNITFLKKDAWLEMI